MSPLDNIETVIATYEAWLTRWVRRSVRDPDVAASIVQDAFLKAYTTRSSFRGECAVRSWLVTIAGNLVRDQLRMRKLQYWDKMTRHAVDPVEIEAMLPSPALSPEYQLIMKDRTAAVRAAFPLLSQAQRTVLALRFDKELSVREIAELTGKPVNTIKSMLHRTLHTLRECLDHAPEAGAPHAHQPLPANCNEPMAPR